MEFFWLYCISHTIMFDRVWIRSDMSEYVWSCPDLYKIHYVITLSCFIIHSIITVFKIKSWRVCVSLNEHLSEHHDITVFKINIVRHRQGSVAFKRPCLSLYIENKSSQEFNGDTNYIYGLQIAQTSTNPEYLDFGLGLPDPKHNPDHHQNCITWYLSYTIQKFR